MATGLDEFAAMLARGTAGQFQAKPFYESRTDSLVFYFLNAPSYSKRITKYLTLFLASKDDRLVGFEVKSVKTIMKATEDSGEVAVVDPIEVNFHGKTANLHIMVKCAMLPDPEEPLAEGQYEEIVTRSRNVRVDLKGAGSV